MSENLSSVDDFDDLLDDEAVNDPEMEGNVSKTANLLDARRRLEERLADRQLEKDLREFDFDF